MVHEKLQLLQSTITCDRQNKMALLTTLNKTDSSERRTQQNLHYFKQN